MSVTIAPGDYVLQLLDVDVYWPNGYRVVRLSFLVVESTPTETAQDENGEWHDTAMPAGSIANYALRVDNVVAHSTLLALFCALFNRPLPARDAAEREREEMQQNLQRSLEDDRHARGRILFCRAKTVVTKDGNKIVMPTWSPVERQFDEAELLAERARLDLAEGIGRGVASLVSALYSPAMSFLMGGTNDVIRA